MMDSDDEREESASWKGVPGVIVLINVFDPSNHNTAAMGHAATCRMLKHYLRTSSSHYIGVSLYGTEDSDSSAFGIKGVTDIIALSTPALDEFKKLRDLNLSTFKQAKDFELSGALWHCSKVFANCKKQLSSRTVILLTRLDTPPVKADQQPTLKRVDDLVDSNIDIKVINVSPDDYDVDLYYEIFLKAANKGKDFILPKPIWDPKDIETVIHQQSHRHLAVARLTFDIGTGFSISVGVYNLLIRSSHYLNKKVNLESETNEIVTSVTKMMKKSTAEQNSESPMDVDNEEREPKKMPVLKSEVLHYQQYGGERIEFADNELKKIRNPFGPPMLKLLGFKPSRIMCKEKWFLKTGYFLFPNESIIEGSTMPFKAMHQACVETSMVAICVLCTRVNSRPHIVALSPCSHPLGLDVEIGFDVIQIPFVENVRDMPAVEKDETAVSDVQKRFMKGILQQLKFEYKFDMFENPKVQSEFRAIEAIALNEVDIEQFVDTTTPSPEKFEGVQEDLFEELFGPFGPVAPKRPATQRENGGGSKKAKTEFDETEIEERVKFQTVNKYTVPQLRELLKRKQDSSMPALNGLKKDELCNLVYQHYG